MTDEQKPTEAQGASTPPDSGLPEGFKTKADLEAYIDRRSSGLHKQIIAKDQAIAEREQKLAEREAAIAELSKAKEELTGKLTQAEKMAQEAAERATKIEIFTEVYGPRLIPGIEPKHLPDTVYQHKDGKLTKEAQEAFEGLLKAKPAWARQMGTMPKPGPQGTVAEPTSFIEMAKRAQR